MKTLTSTDFIKNTSKDYSIYVCQNRGIPCVADGLKDAQRKILYVIKSQTDKIKTISLSGLSISSNLYLHGDTSASDAISHMAAPYCNNVTLLHGIGAFGTRVGPTDWGAPRYTYVKKNVYTESLIYHDYEIIPLKENYDGSVMEPKHFLPLIPIVLLNGISGIAVGWSTDILPRSLDDLIDATLAAIDKKKIPELMPKYDYINSRAKYLGDNSYEFNGKVEIDGYVVYVKELPPDLSLEKFKTRLNKLEDEGHIQTYIDRSTRDINIEVRFKRGSITDWTKEDAIDFLKLRSKSTERIVVLDWNGDNIKQYANAEQLIKDFVEWRVGFYKTRYTKWINDSNHELNWYLALKECYDNNLPMALPKSKDKSEIVAKIIKIVKKIPVTSDQIDRIAGLPSYRWAKDSYKEILDKISDLHKIIAEYRSILADDKKMRIIYRKEVMELKKLPKLTR